MEFRGQRRRSETHVSTTDSGAWLYRKGHGEKAVLGYLGRLLTENHHGLVVDVELTEANGRAERRAALRMVERSTAGRATLGTDRRLRRARLRGRAAGARRDPARGEQRPRRRSAVDARTTRHPGYGQSQRRRKLTEEVFGWLKTVGGCRKLPTAAQPATARGLELAAAAFNLVRMARLEATPA